MGHWQKLVEAGLSVVGLTVKLLDTAWLLLLNLWILKEFLLTLLIIEFYAES